MCLFYLVFESVKSWRGELFLKKVQRLQCFWNVGKVYDKTSNINSLHFKTLHTGQHKLVYEMKALVKQALTVIFDTYVSFNLKF